MRRSIARTAACLRRSSHWIAAMQSGDAARTALGRCCRKRVLRVASCSTVAIRFLKRDNPEIRFLRRDPRNHQILSANMSFRRLTAFFDSIGVRLGSRRPSQGTTELSFPRSEKCQNLSLSPVMRARIVRHSSKHMRLPAR
jgi:hypothetical protein